MLRMPFTTSMVLVSPPCFMMGRYTDRWPSTRTTLYWIWFASWALPTSLTDTHEVPSVLTGIRPNWSMLLTRLLEYT